MCGVGFVARNSLVKRFPKQPVEVSERLHTWRNPLEKFRFMTVFSIYAPTLSATEADKDSFYDCLSAEQSRVPSADENIV